MGLAGDTDQEGAWSSRHHHRHPRRTPEAAIRDARRSTASSASDALDQDRPRPVLGGVVAAGGEHLPAEEPVAHLCKDCEQGDVAALPIAMRAGESQRPDPLCRGTDPLRWSAVGRVGNSRAGAYHMLLTNWWWIDVLEGRRGARVARDVGQLDPLGHRGIHRHRRRDGRDGVLAGEGDRRRRLGRDGAVADGRTTRARRPHGDDHLQVEGCIGHAVGVDRRDRGRDVAGQGGWSDPAAEGRRAARGARGMATPRP